MYLHVTYISVLMSVLENQKGFSPFVAGVSDKQTSTIPES